MIANRIFSVAVMTVMLAILSGCASAPPPKEVKLVWPAPPQPTRITFLRSYSSDESFDKEKTASEKLLNFLGGEKPPQNRIVQPVGIAVSDDGSRLYVSDSAQSTVFLFDLGHETVTKIGGSLAKPSGLALDSAGNVYVVETEKKGVSVFDRSGKPIRFITNPSLERPTGIALDLNRGKLYLADTGHTKSKEHLVRIFDLEGKPLGTIGQGKGSGEGQFMFPTHLAVDEAGNLYVSDTLNSRVQLFNSAGKYLMRFGERGDGWGMFDKPKGVALDSFGNLYVVDSGWSNVQIFNEKGKMLLFFGGRGPVPGMLRNPTAIAIDKKNRIYVGDFINSRVEVYQLVNTTAADSFLNPPDKPAADGEQAGNEAAVKKRQL